MYVHHVKGELGHMYITQISTKDIDKFTLKLAEKKYSEGFIKSNFNFIAAVFSFALKQNYLKDIPTDKASIPRVTKPIIEVLNPEQIQKMIELLSNTNLLLSFQIGISTGMRVGEVFGLRWKDINFKNNTIDINKQLIYETDHWCLGLPKTDGSKRTIRMSKDLSDYLRIEKEKQIHNRKSAGEWYVDNKVFNNFTRKSEIVDDFVNVKDDGTFLTPDSSKYINRVAKANGINFHFHLLRHTHATQLLEGGASIKLVQERLGHARPEITLQTYSHVSPIHESNIIDNLPLIQHIQQE